MAFYCHTLTSSGILHVSRIDKKQLLNFFNVQFQFKRCLVLKFCLFTLFCTITVISFAFLAPSSAIILLANYNKTL